MSEEKRAVKVIIFGNEYIIKGDGNEEYIQRLAQFVNDKMKEIETSTHLTSPLKISILTSINLADEIFRLRSHQNEIKNDKNIEKSISDSPIQNTTPTSEAIEFLCKRIQSALSDE